MLSRNLLLLATTVTVVSLLSPLCALADKGGHPHKAEKDAEKAAREAQKDAAKAQKEAQKAADKNTQALDQAKLNQLKQQNQLLPGNAHLRTAEQQLIKNEDTNWKAGDVARKQKNIADWTRQYEKATDPVHKAELMQRIKFTQAELAGHH